MDKLGSIQLHLSNGKQFNAHYYEEEYEEIYDIWASGSGVLALENCCVRSKDVILIEYIESVS